ncbi:hypothetical protein Hanom_Chr00s000003g01605521 [Helianthus anomalus]
MVEEIRGEFRSGFVEQSRRRGSLPPEEFCRQSFVIAKASEVGRFWERNVKDPSRSSI